MYRMWLLAAESLAAGGTADILDDTRYIHKIDLTHVETDGQLLWEIESVRPQPRTLCQK